MGDSLALVCERNASSVFPRKERERTCLPARSANRQTRFLFVSLSQAVSGSLPNAQGWGVFVPPQKTAPTFCTSFPTFSNQQQCSLRPSWETPSGGVGKAWGSLEARSCIKIQTSKRSYDSSLYSLLTSCWFGWQRICKNCTKSAW